MAECLIERIQALMMSGNVAEVHIKGLQPLTTEASSAESPLTFAGVAIGVAGATGKFRMHLEKTEQTANLAVTLAATLQELEDAANRHAEHDA